MPTDPRVETLALLRSIDSRLESIATLIAAAMAVGLTKGAPGSAPAVAARMATPAAIASDADLDGQYGNPQVKFKPRDWSGPEMKGRKFSDCPAEFLELYAQSLDWSAGQADQKQETTSSGKPVSYYKRMDAARARGWARRNQGRPAAAPPPFASVVDGPAFEDDTTPPGWS